MLFSQISVFLPVLAIVKDNPSSAEVVIVGFLFVLLVLSTLGIVTAALGRIFQAAEAKKNASSDRPACDQTVKSDGAEHQEIPWEIQAVVIASVHTVLAEQPHRIVAVKEVR